MGGDKYPLNIRSQSMPVLPLKSAQVGEKSVTPL